LKYSGFIMQLLVFCLAQSGAKGQYFAQFMNSKDGKAIPDLSVHLSFLPEGKSPVYNFYVTDQLGMVQLKDSGSYLLQISTIGYAYLQDTVYIRHTKAAPHKIRLQELEFNLDEVVVTGEYEIKTTDQSLNRVHTIDRKRIEKQGAVNLKDLLSNELNIRLSTDPVLGTGLSLQGVSGQNIKILIDGVPVIGRTDGNLDLTQINLSNIERVEIIEGPMSVIYGTDALGGVINLITKKSSRHTFELGANSFYESNGTFNTDGRLSFRKKAWNAQLSGGRNFFPGLAIGNDIRSRTWKPREQYFADAIAGVKIKNSLHRLQVSLFEEKLTARGEPVMTPYAVYAFDQYFYTSRKNTALYSDFRLSPQTTLNFIQSYSFYRRAKNTYRKDLVELEQKLTGAGDDQDTSDFGLLLFRGILTHRFKKSFSIQGGYDINLETGTGAKLENRKQVINDYAVFITAEYQPVKRLSLKPGMRFIYNTRFGAPAIDVALGGKTLELPFVPSFNVKYDLLANLAFRASYARGFRAPSLKELNLFFVDINHNIRGNTDLSAENSNNLNASFTYTRKLGGWNFKLEPSAYHNRIYDMINLALVNSQAQLYQYVNIDHFRTQGISVSGEARREGLSVQAGYASIGRYNHVREASGKAFSYSPEYRVNATYTVPKLFVDIAVFYKHTGATPGFALDENSQVVQTRINGYKTLDFSLSKNFWKRRVNIIAGAKNFLNVTNVNYSGASGGGAHSGGGTSLPVSMGRTYFVSLRFNFIGMK
jgi:outer membrane receptor for ferrienterochelin and colicins